MDRFAQSFVKALLALIGAAWFLGVFWVVCRWTGWDAPAWAWFIVGWMGHNDFFDALTYKHNASLFD